MASPRRTSRKSDSKPARTRSRFGRYVRSTFIYGSIIALLAAFGLGVAVAVAASNLPSFEELRRSPAGQTIRVHDVSGAIIVSLGPNYGRWLSLTETPKVMRDAMVAVEDRRFRYHFGIDPIGMARSVWVGLLRRGSGRRLQGASTITQQLARNIFLSNNYSLTRKAKEAVLALALEWKFSKDELLELYLNKVYFGGGSYGIDAASRRFFGHSATRLDLSEAAIIAGLVKAPSRYSPTADAQAAIDRANVVLDVMVDAGAITPAQRAAAGPANVALAHEDNQNSARYFTDWALPQLDAIIDESVQPLDVWTTLDLGMQRQATAAIQSDTPRGAQGALVAMERDGAVRAMVGGRDYVTSNYNRATQAERQPGSAWKLFVYMAALESGYQISDRVVDQPVTIAGWSPRNSSGRYSGAIDLRTAFAYSINTVAAQLGNAIGYSTVANMARRFGITTEINTHPSMVLGTSDVRLIDMTSAFAAVSAEGHAVHPYAISRVTTADGQELYRRPAEPQTVLVDTWVAAGITDLLQTAVNIGTGRAAQIGRPVAGKTGTTSSNKDGWFLGFSSGLTTGVWMGRDDARAVPGLQGGRAPAQAFADFMRVAVANRPIEPFKTAVELPQWQLESDEDAYIGEPTDNATYGEEDPVRLAPDETDNGGLVADDAPKMDDQPVPERRPTDLLSGTRGNDERRNEPAPPRRPAPVPPSPVTKPPAPGEER